MRRKVLVIDDEEELCALIMRILSDSEYKTDCAHTFTNGKKKWEEWNPDIVILDHNLPDGVGLDLIQSNPNLLKKSIIILISADTQELTRERASALGIPEFINKPFSMIQIMNAVDCVGQRA